jgi:hypothetical protein
MKKVILLFLVVILSACGGQAPTGPQIRAEDVWSRPAVAMPEGDMEAGHGMSGTGAVFMTLVNDGVEADRLVGAQADVAEVVEIHQTTMDGDVMKMQQVAAVEVPGGGQVVLKPGDYHVMLIGLHHDLAEGDRFSVTLTFEKSGDLTVEAQVRQP